MAKTITYTKNDLERISNYRKTIRDLHHGAYRRKYDIAMNGNSLRAAVDARCMDCNAWQKNEVKNCPAVECPLWSHRPYRQNRRESHSVPRKATIEKENA